MKLTNYLLLGCGIGFVSFMFVFASAVVHPVRASATDDGQQPFQTQLCDTASCVASGQDSFTVPVNHRLVIQFVTGHCADSEATVFLSTTVKGNTVAHNFVPIRTANVVGTEASFSQLTRLYADAGTKIVLSGDVPFPTCSSVTLSGLLATARVNEFDTSVHGI